MTPEERAEALVRTRSVPSVVVGSPVWGRSPHRSRPDAYNPSCPMYDTEGEADAAMSEALLLWARGAAVE